MKMLRMLLALSFLGIFSAGCRFPEGEGEGVLPGPDPVESIGAEPVAEEAAPAARLAALEPDPSRPRAADFTLASLEGGEVNLSGALGENGTVIVFWASWCPPCVRSIPAVKEFYESRGKPAGPGRTAVISVNVGERPEQARAAVERHGISYPVLLDRDNAVTGQYGVTGIPTVFLLDGEMGIVYRGNSFREMADRFFSP